MLKYQRETVRQENRINHHSVIHFHFCFEETEIHSHD